MKQARIDLFLGAGILARRVLCADNAAQIGSVVCHAGAIADAAAALGLAVVDVAQLGSLEPATAALSLHFPAKIPSEVLARYEVSYNLHPGYLPWGRGSDSVPWAMWEGCPAGATLHAMDASLDAGPVVEQIEVAYDLCETLNAVARRVVQAELELLDRYWPRICVGEILPVTPQSAGGSSHTRMDAVSLLLRMRDERTWSGLGAPELMRFLRCWGQADFQCGKGTIKVSVSEPAST